MIKKSIPNLPIIGYSDTETVMLDFDDTPFEEVKKWAIRTMNFHGLEGFIILKSSKDCYHVVFDRPVSWSENMRIVAWVSLLSGKKKLKKYCLMQCIKQSSTLRISQKGEKPSPHLVFRFGKQNNRIADFLSKRNEIKRIIQRIQKKLSTRQINYQGGLAVHWKLIGRRLQRD